MALTDEQSAFIQHSPSKSARVLAGPGTGKSFTSVAYLNHVLENNPDIRVGYITFTRAATAEFAKKLDEGSLNVIPRTMHGFSLGILLKHQSSAIPYPLRILDSWEIKHIVHTDISKILKSKGFDKATPTIVRILESEMSAGFQSLKNEKLPFSDKNPQLVNAYRGVQQSHRTNYGYTLLHELPYYAGKVLEDIDESDLELDLLIVDEYQDLNHADQKVLTQIAKRGVAIIAIGDDDQSIYSWRKAAPDGIRQFLDNFDTELDYPLTVSMRCGGKALEVATSLIEQDSDRKMKQRLSPSETAIDTGFHYIKYKSNMGEAKGVAQIVSSRIKDGVAPNDIALLVRSSVPAWTNNLKQAFEESGIQIGESIEVAKVLATPAVRKAIAMAQLLINPDDSVAWRALLFVTKGVGEQFINKVLRYEMTGNFSEKLLAAHQAGFPSFGTGSNQAASIISETLEWAANNDLTQVELEENGWGGWLALQVGEEQFTSDALTLLKAVGSQVGNENQLSRFLAEFESSAKELASKSSDGVRIMTMGQSKGLTVNTAIVLGVEDGNIPYPNSEINEELRLLYVAFTRATHMTVATYVNRRRGPTAFVGRPNVWVQREQSSFMRSLEDIELVDGDNFMI